MSVSYIRNLFDTSFQIAKEKMTSLTPQQRMIATIAAVTFSLFSLSYIVYKRYFQVRKSNTNIKPNAVQQVASQVLPKISNSVPVTGKTIASVPADVPTDLPADIESAKEKKTENVSSSPSPSPSPSPSSDPVKSAKLENHLEEAPLSSESEDSSTENGELLPGGACIGEEHANEYVQEGTALKIMSPIKSSRLASTPKVEGSKTPVDTKLTKYDPNSPVALVLENEDEYIGFVTEEGIPEGEGELLYKDNKSEFKGTFHNGQPVKGTMIYENKIEDEGTFEGRKIKGDVKRTYPNGDVYTGPIKDGRPHGKGVMEYKNDGSKYEGYFENGQYKCSTHSNPDKQEVPGKIFYKDGTIIEGRLINRHNSVGPIRKTCSNGDIYDVPLKDGKLNGRGTWTRPTGQVTKGKFTNNEPVGHFTILVVGRVVPGTNPRKSKSNSTAKKVASQSLKLVPAKKGNNVPAKQITLTPAPHSTAEEVPLTPDSIEPKKLDFGRGDIQSKIPVLVRRGSLGSLVPPDKSTKKRPNPNLVTPKLIMVGNGRPRSNSSPQLTIPVR